MRTALAYLNQGVWVADCPEPGCTDARWATLPEGLPGGRPIETDVCALGHPFAIRMPPADEARKIAAYLIETRPLDKDRDWYPAGHPRAEAAGWPTGQTLDDLKAETGDVIAYRTAQEREQRERLEAALAAAGIEIRPDGSFSGSVF